MATPKRFFVEEIGEEVALTEGEFRHAKNVLRLTAGDEVTLLDGTGKAYSAIVSRVEKARMLLHVTGEQTQDTEPMSAMCLIVGLLKGDKTELVVQKATELGAERVVVFSSAYSSAYINDNKLERFRRVAQEAAKQCRRTRAPEIIFRDNLKGALEEGLGYESKLFACEFLRDNAGTMSAVKGSCALVVGSEGGFSEEEFSLALEMGYAGVSLGRRILRAETAAIALLSVAAYFLGELG